jgi:RND family efflux transporter MFP subunit
MFNRARRFIRFSLTVLLVCAATFAVVGLWWHYMVAPWTRDGQVRVQVANIAPQVAGSIVELHVHYNQFVHKGDLLYVIDRTDYKIALDMANADVASRKADLDVKQTQAARRQQLTTLSTSIEEKQRYAGDYEVAQGAYQTALANLEKAKVNLDRTDVRSTVNGYVTNLLLRVGDYANTGSPNIAIIDSDSFWVTGYFEETKLGSFEVGDAATVHLMGYRQDILGHVESITRGISTANAAVSTQGLPSVQAVYTWVRLAQRIPVRIKIDKVPDDMTLSAGMTATVVIAPRDITRTSMWSGIRTAFSDFLAGR